MEVELECHVGSRNASADLKQEEEERRQTQASSCASDKGRAPQAWCMFGDPAKKKKRRASASVFSTERSVRSLIGGFLGLAYSSSLRSVASLPLVSSFSLFAPSSRIRRRVSFRFLHYTRAMAWWAGRPVAFRARTYATYYNLLLLLRDSSSRLQLLINVLVDRCVFIPGPSKGRKIQVV